MSKRQLKVYLKELKKEELEEQIMDLYNRFKEVKTYYNFAFNPREDKLIEECKFKISREYFPVSGRRPKMRRSVAQKYIKHFQQLGVDAPLIIDVMLYSIEVAQSFSMEKPPRQDAFYKSMLVSFEKALLYIEEQGYYRDFAGRISGILDQVQEQRWVNAVAFERKALELHSKEVG